MAKLDSSCFGPVLSVAKPNFPLHPLCTVWQPMSDVDFDRMVATAKRLGGIFNNPATVWNGEILDGRNRQAVCQKVGCKFEYREFRGDYEAARDWVISMNFNRRHMTASQRAMMVANLADVDSRNGYGDGAKREHVAEVAKVSKTTADAAIKLKKTGDETVIEQVLRGETTLSKAMREKKQELLSAGIDEKTATGANIQRKNRIDRSEDLFADATGRIVPWSLQDVWKHEGSFGILREKFEQHRLELKALIQSPAGWAITDNYVVMLGDLLRDLDMKRPWHICPHCNGDKKCECALCKKKWLGRGRDNELACYCCSGHGFLLKDEPYPEVVWVREPKAKPMESANVSQPATAVPDDRGDETDEQVGSGDDSVVLSEELSSVGVHGDSGGEDDHQE